MGVGVRAIAAEHNYLHFFLTKYFVMVRRKLSWCESDVSHHANKNIEKNVATGQCQLSYWVQSRAGSRVFSKYKN